MTSKTRLCVLVAILVCASAVAQNGPDNDPDGAPGYVRSVFDHGQVDSINLYNGQLTLPIPLGPTYPIGPALKLQLVLTYNSQVDTFGKPLAQSADFSYKPLAGNPSLGIGWSLTLGAIKTCQHGSLTFGVCYFGPDGSQHLFNKPQANGSITGDASIYFLKGTGPYDMWDADGNHYEFGNAGHVTGYDAAATDFAKGRDGWYLTRLTDPFGNSYSVAYWSNINPLWTYSLPPLAPCLPGVAPLLEMPPTSNAGTSWIPKDVTLPSGQKIHVNTGSNGLIGSMILSVDFPVLVNGTLATRTWDFDYGTPEPYAKDCGGGTTLNANLQELSAVNLPTDLAGAPSYRFRYLHGLLTSVTLPTSGSIAYCYARYHFHHGRAGAMRPGCAPLAPPESELVLVPDGQFCDGSAPDPEPVPDSPPGECTTDNPIRWVDNQLGITRRTETVGTASNVTTYSQIAMPRGESGTEPQTLTIVTLPPTDKNASGDAGRQRARAVLFTSSPRVLGPWPATARYSVPGDRVGAAVEERTFDTPPSYGLTNEPFCTGDPGTDEGFCGSKAVRVSQSTYDYDDPANKEGDRRLQKEKTIYGGSACGSCAYHQVEYTPASTWEANGRHYDAETHSGTMGGDGRTVTTDWAPVNWPGGSPTGATILPSLFNQRTTTQGSSTRDEYFEFDPADGFLRGRFVYDAIWDIAFVTCRYDDGAGNSDKEFTRTLSTSSVPVRTYCSSNYPAFPASVGVDGDLFGKDLTFQNGQLVRAGWIKGSGTPPFFFKNLARDATTGWITGSTDSAGLTTTYRYDSLGRVVWIDPPADLSTFVCYESATSTSAYRASAQQTCPVAATNPALTTWSHYDYDGLGRLVRERRLQPAGAVSKRFTLYDALGSARFQSEWVADSTSESVSANLATACVFSGGNYGTARPSSAPGTYRLCFDPFGRSQQVVGAKHSSLSTTSRSDGASFYGDTKETVQTYCVNATFTNPQAATCSSGGISPTTVSQKDAFGRLTSVAEPGGDVTSYAYDVNGKLTLVSQGAQSRIFGYDAAGFLRSETTPERTTTYGPIGSLGNVRSETRPGGLVVTRLFDFAGRPAEEDAGGGKYVVNCYDGSGNCVDGSANFSGGTSPNGKLTRRYGYNWIPTIGPIVDEQFTYSGPNGRLSQQTTSVGNGDLSAATAQSWTYDGLGLVAQHGHPRASGAFTVTNTATNGLFTKVNANGTDVVKAAAYNPAGGLASWTAGNTGTPILTTITQDASLLPRPASIANALWSSGAYAYDSVGDVLQMGTDAFQYDARTRLVGATYGSLPRAFAYDRYGNLTRNGATTWTIDSATNRITQASFGTPRYDARGNLIAYNGDSMSYDALDRQYRNSNSGSDWVYLFDGEGERIAKIPAAFAVLRREMARQIVEANMFARGWTLPACTAAIFADVPCSDPDARYVNALYQQGVTGGCNDSPLQYCPDRTITREEMAVLMVRGYKGVGYVPPPCTVPIFQDVPCSGDTAPYAPYVQQLYNDGVTAGCNLSPLQFCPLKTIGEWETAVWMAKAPTTPPGGFFWAAYHPVPRGAVYTLRDEQNRVVTEMAGGLTGASTATLSVSRDNAFLGNLMVASFASGAWNYSASDHLGSPRAVWDSSGHLVETHKYWPYGEDSIATPPNQRLAYCLMERDTETSRFYDHARQHDFGLGRFLSPDTVGGHPANPQSWNRYAYTLGNPMKHVDPDGKLTIVVHGTWAKGSPTFQPGGLFFNLVAGSVPDRAYGSFSWSGTDSAEARTKAAKALATFIRSYKFAPGEQLNIIAHSHGGNVAIQAINMGLGRAVDNLITLGTPARNDYILSHPAASAPNFVAASNDADPIQANGGNSTWVPHVGEAGAAGRDEPGAFNLRIFTGLLPVPALHSELHESEEVWKQVAGFIDTDKNNSSDAAVSFTFE